MPQFSEIKPKDKRFGTTINDDKGTEYVQSIHTDQTGGLCMVDVVVLRSGRALTITDECVVAWPSLKAWENSFETGEAGSMGGIIDLTSIKEVE